MKEIKESDIKTVICSDCEFRIKGMNCTKNCSADDEAKKLAKYFNALLPQGDKEGLLTPKEIHECYKRATFPIPSAIEKEICKAQKALSYQIKDEEIKKEKIVAFKKFQDYLNGLSGSNDIESLKKELL